MEESASLLEARISREPAPTPNCYKSAFELDSMSRGKQGMPRCVAARIRKFEKL